MHRKLPPLILHPFADRSAPNRLLESSRANLMLQGLLPQGERSQHDLEATLLDGRFSEIRMLFYVGKDLLRWIEQCLEHIDRNPVLRGSGIRYQSLASYLINHTPTDVQAKLKKWGVNDYKAIFARALGLSILLADAPTPGVLSDEFIRNYYRYADHMFRLRQEEEPFAEITDMGFEFDIYASGEYSRKLEREWAEL
ncbi:MAG: hypothetical protein ABL967_19260 [Bryobacteraceae bacterium]